VDWTLLALVVLFAIGGYVRGAVAQLFGILGFLGGLWAATFVWSWVGEHWQGSRPVLVFMVLRWLVASLAGLAVASLFQWWGDSVGKAVREGPLGWLDQGVGLAIGAALGVGVGLLLLLGALSTRFPSGPANAAARARVSEPAMATGIRVCTLGEAYLPGSGWLKQRFLAAKRHAARIRTGGSGSKAT
jgi:uncharacterized membrane protein required for colicin V production